MVSFGRMVWILTGLKAISPPGGFRDKLQGKRGGALVARGYTSSHLGQQYCRLLAGKMPCLVFSQFLFHVG